MEARRMGSVLRGRRDRTTRGCDSGRPHNRSLVEEAQSWANFAAVYWHGPIDPDSEESKMFATWFGSLIIHCMATESQCRYEDAAGNEYIRAPGIDEPFAITQTSLRHWLWMVVLTHDQRTQTHCSRAFLPNARRGIREGHQPERKSAGRASDAEGSPRSGDHEPLTDQLSVDVAPPSGGVRRSAARTDRQIWAKLAVAAASPDTRVAGRGRGGRNERKFLLLHEPRIADRWVHPA